MVFVFLGEPIRQGWWMVKYRRGLNSFFFFCNDIFSHHILSPGTSIFSIRIFLALVFLLDDEWYSIITPHLTGKQQKTIHTGIFPNNSARLSKHFRWRLCRFVLQILETRHDVLYANVEYKILGGDLIKSCVVQLFWYLVTDILLLVPLTIGLNV